MARRRGSTAGLVALLAVTLLAAACRDASEGVSVGGSSVGLAKAKDVELELSISLSKEKFAKGVPIPLRITLRNVGGTPVVVNKRFLVNDRAAPPEFREVTLQIRVPGGKTAKFAWDLKVGFPENKDFRKLGPGAAVSGRADIADLFALSKKGTYRVKAIYENVHRGPTVVDPATGEPVTKNLGAAKVKLTSETIELRIT